MNGSLSLSQTKTAQAMSRRILADHEGKWGDCLLAIAFAL
jgi:hypothetical protein